MALSVSGKQKVKTLKEAFRKEFGVDIRVYKGKKFADEEATLASIRGEGAPSKGDFQVRGNMKVGNVEKQFKDQLGIVIQIENAEGGLAKDDETLAQQKTASSAQTAPKAASKPSSKAAAKPEPKSEAKSPAKPAAKPAGKPAALREMVLFFLIDVSFSMEGAEINAVNTAISGVLPRLRAISGKDAQIKVACLKFGSDVRWMYPSPIAVENFSWTPAGVNGLTNFGAACEELAKKLSGDSFLRNTTSLPPAIFLMSDGAPTDSYKSSLAKLWQNNWFKDAIKVAVAIGTSADNAVLQEFTGSKDAVLTVHTPDALMKMIRFISVTSSEVGSKSHTIIKGSASKTKQKDVEKKIAAFISANKLV